MPLLAFVAPLFLIAVAVVLVLHLIKQTSGPTDYSTDAGWFQRDVDGPKDADCFWAHPTTDLAMS